jgi:hypothetical protein
MAPEGRIRGIEYVIFVPPEGYFALPTSAARVKLARSIGQLNEALVGKCFICVGPGRWGTSNPDLGVSIGYADIYNTQALVELAGTGIGPAPEASFGTHFFQDLVESNIFPLAIYLDDAEAEFRRAFFYDSRNCLAELLPAEADRAPYLRVISVAEERPGYHLELVMDADEGRSVAFWQAEADPEPKPRKKGVRA